MEIKSELLKMKVRKLSQGFMNVERPFGNEDVDVRVELEVATERM